MERHAHVLMVRKLSEIQQFSRVARNKLKQTSLIRLFSSSRRFAREKDQPFPMRILIELMFFISSTSGLWWKCLSTRNSSCLSWSFTWIELPAREVSTVYEVLFHYSRQLDSGPKDTLSNSIFLLPTNGAIGSGSFSFRHTHTHIVFFFSLLISQNFPSYSIENRSKEKKKGSRSKRKTYGNF